MIMKKRCGMHALRIAVGITMLGLLLAGSANAANLTVCPSGCAYSSIQKAINSSSTGDTILVQSGTYFENVKVNKKLTLRGIGNPVVEAGGSKSAITLAADGITLEGFNATGSGHKNDAGIKVTSSNNTMSGNNASNNFVGIYLYSSRNNMLTSNNALNNEYGIALDYSSNNTINGNNASSNNYYIGIGLDYSSNNTLSDNNVYHEFYGISLESSSNNTINSNNVYNNSEGGIYLFNSSDNTLNENNASNNYNDGISLYSSKQHDEPKQCIEQRLRHRSVGFQQQHAERKHDDWKSI
jgi:parallel beta-helix repeat protein